MINMLSFSALLSAAIFGHVSSIRLQIYKGIDQHGFLFQLFLVLLFWYVSSIVLQNIKGLIRMVFFLALLSADIFGNVSSLMPRIYQIKYIA